MTAALPRCRPVTSIRAGMSVPVLIQAVPAARAVLDRYGLHGCGGPNGPPETIAYFARAHEIPLDRLLSEIRAAASRPATLRVLNPPALQGSEGAAEIYRPFFKSGIAVVLTLGAVWGAYLLLRIAFDEDFSSAGVHEVNAHGHAQIFGWVGLFVMGFAYQAFPRFKQTTLASPRLAVATLWMMLAGLVVRSAAQPLAATAEWLVWPAVVASTLEVAAAILFAAILTMTWRKSRRALAFYDGYILSATGWFVFQAIYEAVYLTATLNASGEELISLIATWQGPLRDVQIHGFALLMILGVSQRVFHHFYGLPQANPRLSRAALCLLNVAVMSEVAGGLLMRLAGREWAGLKYLGALLLTGVVAVLVASWRIFSKAEDPDRSLKFLRAAYVWLLASLAMLVLLPVYQFGIIESFAAESHAATIGFSHAWYGATRHAITVGFVSLMIVGVSSKVVPTLNGIRSDRLARLWAPFLLINLGCTLRVTGQILTDFTPAAFPLAGVSGLLEVTGLALWGTHLWLIMSGRPKLRLPATAPEPQTDGRVHAGQMVGAVLERHPELLETFIGHGFQMLADPAVRASIARVVTIGRACRRIGVDPEQLVEELNLRLGLPARPASPARAGDDCFRRQQERGTAAESSLESNRSDSGRIRTVDESRYVGSA